MAKSQYRDPGTWGKTIDEQENSLKQLLAFLSDPRPGKTNFGAMLLLSRPGDVTFAAPITPELRGIEIVSPSTPRDDRRDYDIWKDGHILKYNMTKEEVLEWLQPQVPYTEEDFKRNITRWAEDAMHYYNIPRRA